MPRILYVLSTLQMGGVETWLVELVRSLRASHGSGLAIDILTLLEPGGHYERTLRGLGCGIDHERLRFEELPLVIGRLAGRMKSTRYDVVHCQSDYVSGIVLLAAKLAGIPKRVFHVHSSRFAFGPGSPWPRRLASRPLRMLGTRLADAALCCSIGAMESFYEGEVPDVARVLHCGIDLRPFESDRMSSREAVRSELGLPQTCKVVLYVGRLAPPKNLPLLVEAAGQVARDQDMVLLLAGDGSMRESLRTQAMSLGLDRTVRLLGLRSDVPRLLLASDLVVLPSFFEGLPVSLLQAQAAGIPIVASDRITRESEVIPGLISWLAPSETPERWASLIGDRLDAGLAVPQAVALRVLRGSSFDIRRCAEELLRVYGLGIGALFDGSESRAPGRGRPEAEQL